MIVDFASCLGRLETGIEDVSILCFDIMSEQRFFNCTAVVYGILVPPFFVDPCVDGSGWGRHIPHSHSQSQKS